MGNDARTGGSGVRGRAGGRRYQKSITPQIERYVAERHPKVVNARRRGTDKGVIERNVVVRLVVDE